MSTILIQEITEKTKLTQYQNVKDQIDTIERLNAKLKYDVNNRGQIGSLLKNNYK